CLRNSRVPWRNLRSPEIPVAADDKQKVTSLQDLADLAGVSRATASRALNDSPMISEKTKKKLRRLAQKYNFTPNQRARDFRLKRTSVISVVFMLDVRSDQHMSDPFFLEMLGGIADSLADHDYDLLLAHAPIADVLELRDQRVIRQSDGVIFVGQAEQHEALDALAAQRTPIVVWGGRVDSKNYLLVGGDNADGGYKATRHLLELGRRRIAFLGNSRNPEISARYSGYRRALADFDVEPDDALTFDVPFDMNHAVESIRRIVESESEFDALFCTSDVMALAAISTLTDLGMRVPGDVAVVGYDDISLAAYSAPPLTTVRQNIRWAGRVLVESVLGLVNGEDVTDTVLASELIVRRSCGASRDGEQ
ncbi:MAG: LacI family DNA-binding transcriptional regulator, partial [Proteobacteria bacterium]|nr:LacI family DNA-binding transcriptional regulator [Pseudomonadota bacterium]